MTISVHHHSNDPNSLEISPEVQGEFPSEDWESSFSASAEKFKQRMQRFQEERHLAIDIALPPQVIERLSILKSQNSVIKSLASTSRRGKRRKRHLIREIERAVIRYIVSGKGYGLVDHEHQEARQ